jgi:hypothetical protein
VKARLLNRLLDLYGWLFEQSGFSWSEWRSLSVTMRRDGLHGYVREGS